LYAYEIARNYHNKTKIRVVSLGTGEKTFKEIDPESANVATFVSKSGEFMMNMDSYAAHNYLKTFMPDAKNTYVRLQTTSDIGMDKIDKASINGLQADGARLWTENEASITKILRDMLDERYGSTASATA